MVALQFMNNFLTKNTRMKKLITLCVFAILNVGSFAQNGGMSNENASMKIEYVSQNSSTTIVKVTNKDSCTSNITVQWQQYFRSKSIPGFSSDTFELNTQTTCFIRATSISPCRTTYLGQVELNYCQIVPIKFEYLYVKQLDKHTALVEFKALSTDGEDRFNIQMSKDGRTFTTVAVILPDAIETNKIYKVIVKL